MPATRAQIEALYREHYLGFRRGFAAMTGSYESAHDVVQEAFARALAQRRQLREDAALVPWVWRIALRVMLDEQRRLPVDDLGDRPAVREVVRLQAGERRGIAATRSCSRSARDR